jgi:hypothetical protein
MNSRSKITRTVLHRMGYKKATSQTDFGNDWYFKRRLTRGGKSRCTVQVEFRCNGLVDVNAIEKALVPDAPTGQDYSSKLCRVRDLRSWEKFAFCV